jgi:hypothetical protein
MTEQKPTYPPIPAEFKIIFWSMGDFNKDGVIDETDLNLVNAARVVYNPDGDFNGDGKVDMRDVGLCARNQGLTIEQEWHNTVDREAMQTQLEQTTGVPNLPWYVDWILPILQQQKTNLEAYAYWQNPAMKATVDGFKALADMPELWGKTAIETSGDVLDAQYQKGQEQGAKVIAAANEPTLGGFLEPVGKAIGAVKTSYLDRMKVVQSNAPSDKVAAIKDAADKLNAMRDGIVAMELINWGAGMAAQLASLGQFTGLFEFEPMISSKFNWNTIAQTANLLPVRASLFIPAEQYYNSQYTPNIGGLGDVVKLRHLGKMNADEYKKTMSELGYDDYWREKFLESRLSPPSITDALVAFRRGKIDEAKVNEIFALNDLDPIFQDIFDVRKYDDLSIGEARLMYNLQIIGKPDVLMIAKRNGYTDEDAGRLTDAIVDFQATRLKLRYLLGLVQEVGYGLIDETMARTQTLAIGYSETVAMWVIRTGEQRKRLLARAKAPAVKEKLLAIGDLKSAYVRGLITEDVLRTELLTRGYNLDDISILIALENDRRTIESAGGKMFALSVVEYLNAWKYEVITEDGLRMKLLARGLPVDEIDTLIATKKLQWKMGASPQIGG